MLNTKLTIFHIILVLLFLDISGTVHAQSKITQLDDDRFQIEVSKASTTPVTILQVTDLHLGSTDEGKWKKDIITFRRIAKLVETFDPDMIAITGDLLTGEKPFGSLLCASVVNFFDNLERPWLYVFGNHDPEGGFGRDKIAEVFAVSKWGILGRHTVDSKYKHKYDYAVDIVYEDMDIPSWQIYGFDSGSHKGFKSIKKDQLEWYRDVSEETTRRNGKQIRAISIFHIPLIEYQYLKDDVSIQKHGESRENVTYEEDDGSVYQAFLDVGNIEAVFVGHDHYNNFWGTYKGGIILAYGFISGEATKYAWPPGGKLISLPGDGNEIQIQNVSLDYNENEYDY